MPFVNANQPCTDQFACDGQCRAVVEFTGKNLLLSHCEERLLREALLNERVH